VLDLGAGKRNTIYDQVVNIDIVDYNSTDVICLREQLPFMDDIFETVHCSTAFEHVNDQFACTKEMIRVLKPGGELVCCVHLLQPYHGYPPSYYNLPHQGLTNLFDELQILGIEVDPEHHPIATLIEFVSAYQAGLDEQTRSEFLDLRLRDLVENSFWQLKDQPCIYRLQQNIKKELACCNTIFGYKKSCEVGRSELKIIDAEYGTDKIVLDVTGRIADMVHDNHIFLSSASLVNELFGDPCPGEPKKLKVRWESGVRSGEETIDEFGGILAAPLCL
jgi:hypothetical protein